MLLVGKMSLSQISKINKIKILDSETSLKKRGFSFNL